MPIVQASYNLSFVSHARRTEFLLALVPNPPNESTDSIGAIINDSRQIVFIDEERGTVTRLAPRPEDKVAPIIWWLWDGEGDMRRIAPVLETAIIELLRQYPGSATWKIYGDFPGRGETATIRRADSKARAKAVQAMLGGNAAGMRVVTSSANPNMKRLQSTVARGLAALRSVPQ